MAIIVSIQRSEVAVTPQSSGVSVSVAQAVATLSMAAGLALSAGMGTDGNSAGTAGIVSGRLDLVGGNNITLSQSLSGANATLTIIGGAGGGGGGSFSAGVSTLGNTLGNTGTVSNQLVLAGGNNVTLSQSTNAGGATVTISGAAIPTETPFGVSAGTQSVSTGTVKFADSNGLTWGMSGSSQVTASYSQSTHAHSDLSAGLSNIGNTSGDTGVVTGRLVLAGGNNITLSGSTNAGSMTISVSGLNVGGAQTGISGLANSETTYTSGSVTLSGLANITIRSTTGQHYQFSVANQSAESNTLGMSNLGNTSGDTAIRSGAQLQIVFAGGNSITLSQSTNGSSATITISGATTPAQTAESNTLGMSNLGNTAGTSGVVSAAQARYLFAGGNNITLSQSLNGASGTVTISGANIPAQTQESNTIGMSNIGNTSGDTAIRSGAQLQIVMAGGNNITLSQSTNGSSATVTVSAFNQSAESNTIGMSNIGNTSGDTVIRSGNQLRIVLAGGNNITLSQSTNGSSATITISAFNQTAPIAGNAIQSVSSATNSGAATSKFAAEDHKHAGVGPFGVSTLGGTSGDTGTQYGQVVLAGGNNITLSVSSSNNGAQTITISAPNLGAGAGYTAGMSNLGNTSGTTGVADSRLVIVGGNNITVSQSLDAANHSGTLTISAFNQTEPTVKLWSNIANESRTDGTVDGSIIVSPLVFDGGPFPGVMTAKTMLFDLSGSVTATASSSSHSFSVSVGIYTLDTANNRLVLLNSGSTSWTPAAATNNTASYHGPRFLTIDSSLFSASLTFSRTNYWFGLVIRNSNLAIPMSWIGRSIVNTDQRSGSIGVSVVTATSMAWAPWKGQYSVSSAALPGTISSNDMIYSPSRARFVPNVILQAVTGSW